MYKEHVVLFVWLTLIAHSITAHFMYHIVKLRPVNMMAAQYNLLLLITLQESI